MLFLGLWIGCAVGFVLGTIITHPDWSPASRALARIRSLTPSARREAWETPELADPDRYWVRDP